MDFFPLNLSNHELCISCFLESIFFTAYTYVITLYLSVENTTKLAILQVYSLETH